MRVFILFFVVLTIGIETLNAQFIARDKEGYLNYSGEKL